MVAALIAAAGPRTRSFAAMYMLTLPVDHVARGIGYLDGLGLMLAAAFGCKVSGSFEQLAERLCKQLTAGGAHWLAAQADTLRGRQLLRTRLGEAADRAAPQSKTLASESEEPMTSPLIQLSNVSKFYG